MEDAVDPVGVKLRALEEQLTEHVEDFENRGRGKNIPTCYFESWLSKILNIAIKRVQIKLDSAYRFLAPMPIASQKLRVIQVRFNNIQDKQCVMNAARNIGEKKINPSNMVTLQ